MRVARVGVPVTSVWRSAEAAAADDDAITRPAPDAAEWVRGLDLTRREALLGRMDTQALLGEPALVVAEENGWAKVRLPWQPSTAALDGYPGWVPAAHLIDDRAGLPTGAGDGAVVTALVANAIAEDGERLQLSFGTVLPVASDHPVALRHPDGRTLSVDRGAIRLPDERGAVDVIDLARQFLGLPYLWAGVSGHGVDCSGFVHVVNRVAGRVVPRDAHDQSVVGTAVADSAVHAGDAVYFENATGVHHTGFAIDAERLIHSPRTGKDVTIGSIVADYPGELQGFRRFTVA